MSTKKPISHLIKQLAYQVAEEAVKGKDEMDTDNLKLKLDCLKGLSSYRVSMTKVKDPGDGKFFKTKNNKNGKGEEDAKEN